MSLSRRCITDYETGSAFVREWRVRLFNPAYTSQTCPVCGHTERANRNKKNHFFACKQCGYRFNDDRIGAMNLYRKGIEHLSTVTSE